jgi:hypothetical protein
MRHRFGTVQFAIALTGLVPLSVPAAAQTYSTTPLLDQNTPRPDGQGNFNPAWTIPTPFSGSTIAFVNFGSTTQEIWTIDPDTHAFTKLVDTTVKVPGGVGTFSTFYPPNNNIGGLAPKIQDGVLFFWGEDQNGGNGYGLYSIKLTGGAVHRLVNYKTAKPEGGTFDFIESFAVSGARVLFNTPTGVFVTTGGKPTVVVDGSTQILIGSGPSYYGCYSGAAIDGETVAVVGSNCFDPSRGLNVLFVGPYDNFASLDKLPVVNSNETLPGDDNPTPHLDVIGDSVFLSGNLLYFGAVDTYSTASGGFYGQYYAPFKSGGAPTTPSGSPIYKIFDNVTSGLTGSFGHFGSAAFDEGTLAFEASNTSSGVSGLYLANGPRPVLISTDLQRGVAVPLGISEGRVAFGGSGFFDSQVDLVAAASCGVSEVAGVKIAKGKITPGGTAGAYSQTITLTNLGTTALTGPVDLALSKLSTGDALLNQDGVTSCVAPAGAPYITVSADGLAVGAKVMVTLDVWSPAKASFSFTPLILNGAGAP